MLFETVIWHGRCADWHRCEPSQFTARNGEPERPGIARLSQQTTADADRVVQHMFWLGVVLILILLAGAVVAGLACRALANKMSAGRKSSGP